VGPRASLDRRKISSPPGFDPDLPALSSVAIPTELLYIYIYTVCPTRYRTRHFFNTFTTNEDIATKFEADYRHIPLHFSHNELIPVQISLQYLHWC